jgi:outer membrane receptor protein involved in Fe transport
LRFARGEGKIRAGAIALVLACYSARGDEAADGGALATTPTAPQGDLADYDASDLAALSLEEILNLRVVTATHGVGEERSLTSANVYSITRNEIARHGWRSVAEALATVPGLYVVEDLVHPSVGVRGVTGGLAAGTRIVKVMIDGHAVNFRPELNAFIGPEYIPVEAIDRIEIAKGPLSALYGANAFIATVNVITRKAEHALRAEVEARGAWLNHPGGGASAFLSYGDEARELVVAFSSDQIDRSGLGLTPTFAAQNPDAPIFHSASRDDLTAPTSAFARARIAHDRLGSFSLEGGVQRLDSTAEFQLGSILTHSSRVSITNGWAVLGWERSWERISASASLGYSQGAPDHRLYEVFATGNPLYSYVPNYGYRAVDAKLELSFSPLERLQFQLGADTEVSFEDVLFFTRILHQPEGTRLPGDTSNEIDPSKPTQRLFSSFGSYLQVSSEPFPSLPDLHLTGNFRLDRLSNGSLQYPLQYSWRAAVAYRWNPSLVTKIVGGRAFQIPSSVMLFSEPYGTENNLIGNQTRPDFLALKPQVIHSVEAIASGHPIKSLTAEGGVYFQNLQDQIEFDRSGNNFIATNKGERSMVGVEGTLRFGYKRFSSHLNVSVQTSDLATQQAPPAYPTAFGALGAQLDLPELYLQLSALGRVVGPRAATQSNIFLNNRPYDLPGYAKIDATISSLGLNLFPKQMGETTFMLSVRNLANARVYEPGFGGVDAPTVGRTFFAAARQSF